MHEEIKLYSVIITNTVYPAEMCKQTDITHWFTIAVLVFCTQK